MELVIDVRCVRCAESMGLCLNPERAWTALGIMLLPWLKRHWDGHERSEGRNETAAIAWDAGWNGIRAI